jgi:hypothetical protein
MIKGRREFSILYLFHKNKKINFLFFIFYLLYLYLMIYFLLLFMLLEVSNDDDV